MPRRSRLYLPEHLESLARGLTRDTGEDWRYLFGPKKSDNSHDAVGLLNAFRAKHPTRAATRKQAALRAAGHYLAFERLGMVATFATIRAPEFEERDWQAKADAVYRAHRKADSHAPDAATLFRGEAIAALAGPIAEELFGGGDVLTSISQLSVGKSHAWRAAELKGREKETVLREVRADAITLVIGHENDIWDVAQMLVKKKRADSRDNLVRNVKARMPRGAVATATLSGTSQHVFEKIGAALIELGGLETAGDEQLAGDWS